MYLYNHSLNPWGNLALFGLNQDGTTPIKPSVKAKVGAVEAKAESLMSPAQLGYLEYLFKTGRIKRY